MLLAMEIAEELALADGAVDLASVGVAADADIECAEAYLLRILNFFRQQDCTGAGTEGWLLPHELLEPFESGSTKELEECAAFASGDDEAVDRVELLGLLDEHNLGAQLLEPAAVGVKIALQSKDSDLQSQSLSARRKQCSTATTPF